MAETSEKTNPGNSSHSAKYTNRLIQESSPYLLQHAHNPVDWYPWGEEAFEIARKEEKPVLVSIGYAACHWCHVMERESFEDPEVAGFMNRHFVNIKVDREERPDVDHIYMDAVQAISGSGGWPLNVFLTPDKKPFYGGTYFPPVKAFNRSSWTEVLQYISKTFNERREEVNKQSEALTDHLKLSTGFGRADQENNLFEAGSVDQAFQQIMMSADKEWGGFGRAPKFPQSFTINFLLQYAHLKKNDQALNQARLSLDKMIQGGIYDQAGGGFARYSTDTEWLAPHFEKMLYDNALLISTLSDAYSLTHSPVYHQVIRESLGFIERELMHAQGGFFSALDADSEGEEGRFYVWDLEEARLVLGDDAELMTDYFDISSKGNWEGKNILRILKPLDVFSKEKKIDEGTLLKTIERSKKAFLKRREERVRPQLDDKVILGWNALMNQAYSKAYAATGDPHYKEVAERNMQFLLTAFQTENQLLHHSWKDGKSKHPAFLDDYASLISALIELAQVTASLNWFQEASRLTEIVLENFSDPDSSIFFYTHKNQFDIPVRKKEIYDGATPSGNSVMAYNLYRLSIVFDRKEWREKSEQMILSLGEVIVKYPTSFGVWLSLLYEVISGTDEIIIIGKEWKKNLEKMLGIYISHKLALASEYPLPEYPLLADKARSEEILFYLCKNYSCRQPVTTLQELIRLL